MKVTTFLTEKFETVEALAVIDVLRRAGIEVDTVAVSDSKTVKSAQGICVEADYIYKDYSMKNIDMIFLPGGPGHIEYEKNEDLIERIREFDKEGKYIAAICAAPSVIGRMGILEGRKATCFPGYEDELKGAVLADVSEKVVTDGHIITSRGMGTSIDLGLELVSVLKSREEAELIAKKIQYIS